MEDSYGEIVYAEDRGVPSLNGYDGSEGDYFPAPESANFFGVDDVVIGPPAKTDWKLLVGAGILGFIIARWK